MNSSTRIHYFVILSGLCAAGLFAAAQPPSAASQGDPPSAVVRAGTVLQIRLRNPISSYGSKRNSPILAEVIAPVEQDDKVILPARTQLSGRIREVRKVGLGFSRETALLDLEFSHIAIPGLPIRAVTGQVVRLDDARERVDDKGRIRGIRATDTFATTLSGLAIGAAAFDPFALTFALTSSLSVFRLPDSSIILPTGAELQFKLLEDLPVPGSFPPPYSQLIDSEQTRSALTELVRPLPFRTTTEGAGEPSDLTSLLYLGSREAIERAFLAAGWVRSDQLDAQSTFGVMRSVVENQGYRAAPMSVLLLDGKKPEFTYAKTLNTFFSRHHLRIYGQDATYQGKSVWTSTATYDSGIGFSKAAKTFIHIINENIDEERTKVVNDLVHTGCVSGVGYINRAWVPLDAKNATGDSLRTDGRIAVLELNDCSSPVNATVPARNLPDVKLKQAAFLRPFRSAFLTLRNDFTRGNLAYQAYAGIRLALDVMRPDKAGQEEAKTIRYGGQEFAVVAGAAPPPKRDFLKDPGHRVHHETVKRQPKSYASRLMFSASGGLAGYGNPRFSTLPMYMALLDANGSEILRDPIPLETKMERGWTISPKVTLNSWKYVSNEFAYSRTITNFQVSGRDQILGQSVDERSKAAIRQFSYNALFHLRPNGSRFRPYVAVGPAFHLIHLLEAQPQGGGLLKLAARDVALFKTAYDFGTKPPLEGGGIFQPGLNYGAGASIHLTPRIFLKADFRETLSRQPDFWKSSAAKLAEESSDAQIRLVAEPLIKHGPLRYQVVTLGIGISF